MDTVELLETITTFLAFAMLLIALSISGSTTVKRMIRLYQIQALILTAIVLLIAAESEPFNLILLAVAVLPLFLALTINFFLRRATQASPRATERRQANSPRHRVPHVDRGRGDPQIAIGDTTLIWLQLGHHSQRRALISIGVNLVLIVIAFVVAYQLVGIGGQETISTNILAVSMALLLLGISIMTNKRDTIAQIVGLLVVEHGLFLAAVKIIAIPTLAFGFGVSLFFYIIITLTILLWILPALHRISGSVELDDQQQLWG